MCWYLEIPPSRADFAAYQMKVSREIKNPRTTPRRPERPDLVGNRYRVIRLYFWLVTSMSILESVNRCAGSDFRLDTLKSLPVLVCGYRIYRVGRLRTAHCNPGRAFRPGLRWWRGVLRRLTLYSFFCCTITDAKGLLVPVSYGGSELYANTTWNLRYHQ